MSRSEQLAAAEILRDPRPDRVGGQLPLKGLKGLVDDAQLQGLSGGDARLHQAQRRQQAPEIQRLGGDLAAVALLPQVAEQQGELLTNARQAEAAQRAEQALEAVRDGLEAGMSPDAVLSDVEFAMAALAEVTGRRVTEDVTARIFSRFCVGK